nr:coiled-coil domain-containing protein 168 [Meriones unguiculatus]
MTKSYHFFKNRLKSVLDENTFCKLWDFLDYWIFNNAWIPILFIIFLGVAFEIILVRTCEFFKKKLELWKNGSLGSQKQNEDGFPKGMTFATESWSITHSSSAERVETLSGQVTTTHPSEENGDNTSDRVFSSDDCEFQGSHFYESYSSSGGTSASLSMFHSEVKKIFVSHRKEPQREYQAIQISSNNLFSIMKTNSTKSTFPDDLRFQNPFKTTRDKDLNVAPCPPVHLFLSSNQIRHVEENIRRRIPVNPTATLVREVDYLHRTSQEPSIHNQHSNEVVIPVEEQDTFLNQNVIQNQMIHEAQFTSQIQQFIHNQESFSSQPGFAQPPDFIRVPFSSSTQDLFQAQDRDRKEKSQHFIHIPCIVGTQDSTQGIESDENFSETQYSVYFSDPKEINYLVKGQNSVFQNAEFLSLSPKSSAEAIPQQKGMPESHQPIPSLDSNQYDACNSMSLKPTIKRQRNKKKIPDNERKLNLKVPSLKAKKMSCSQLFPNIVCHTLEKKIELRPKKKIVYQRKIMAVIALHLISVSKLITYHVKKYFLKNLEMVIPDIMKHEHFLQEQNGSPDTEKISFTSSTDKGSVGVIENLEHAFTANTDELAAPCSLFETNGEKKESSEDSAQQAFDLNIPKHEGHLEMLSESSQKDVLFPNTELNRRMKVQNGQTTENGDELTVSILNTQRCFPKDKIQQAKNSMEITLNFSGINSLIAPGSQQQEKNELKDVTFQMITGSINLKEEEPLMTSITEYGKPSDSEKLECNTRTNKKNRHQDERMSETSENATEATISEPFDMELCSRLKAKAETPTINCSNSALKREKLPDKKKIQEVKHPDKGSICRKPEECDRERKERETVPSLADVRVIICLKQKDKCVQFEMEQIQSENRTIQSEEEEVQPRTSSTQTVWKTSSHPSTDPLQVEKIKQRTVKPTDKEWTADAMHPSLVPENLPIGEYLIKTTECRVPFSGNPTETMDGHIPEEEDLKKDLCAVAIRSFKTRKKSSGTKNVLSVKHGITKVKKPAFFLRFCITPSDTLNHKRKIGDSFESIIKQMLHNAILAHGLLNVHPHRYLIPNKKANIKIIPPKPQVEKKENSLDVLTKESKALDTLEVQLCCGMKVLKQAQPEVVAQRKRSFGCDAPQLEESETEKQVFQAVSFKEAIKTTDSLRMDSFSVANRKNSTSTQTELRFSAELELVPPTSEKLAMGDYLSQSRESNIPNSGNDTREISCSFTQKVFLWSLNYYMPVLAHSKKKKDRTKFTNTSTAKFKFMNKVKPPASKTFNITSNKKSKLDHKIKFKKINQAKALLPECQNTVCLSIHSRLQGGFCHAQLKQRELANKTCVDGIAESSAIYDREKNLQEKQAALCRGQHLWAGADQSKDTLFNDPDPSPISLSQEQLVKTQSVKRQKDFLQSTLEATLQIDPTESEGLQKTTKTENDIKFPVVPKILSPKAGNSSPSEFTNMTDDDLEFDKNSESELDSYPVEKDSETSINLQSSDSFTRSFVSRPKRMRKAPRSKKKIPVNQRHRAMGEIKPSWTVNLRYSKKLKQNKEMKGPQQKCNIEVACLDVIHSNIHILPNKNIRNSKTWTGQQRIRRFGHMQLMQEKSPNERSAQCPDSADASSSSSLKNYKEEKKEKLEDFLVSENSPGLIFDMYQEKDHDLVRSYKQLNPQGRATTQVQPQTPTEAILCSTTRPIPEELQLEKLQGCFSMFLLKVGNAKDKALSEKQCDLSNERLYKEQAGNSEKEAKELSVSYTNPDYHGEKKCDSTEMQGMNQEKKIADEPSSSSNVALDINISSKIEIGKGTLREKTLHSIQMKAETLHHEETITTDDIKEIDIQNKEEEKKNDKTLLKSLPQDSQHFAYSHQSREPKSHKLGKQRGRNILSIVERSNTKKSRWADITRREYDMYISNSKLPPLKPGDPQINKINTDRTKYERPADGTQAQELNSWDRVERKGLKNYLQATIPEIVNLTTSDVPKSKRQSKVSRCKALQGKMCSTGVTMKGRKTSVSKVLTIPQCSQRKNLLPKTLKSQISGLLTQSDVLPDNLNIIILKDPTAEKNKRLLTQELTATMLESLGFSTPISKERENFKFMDKRDEMSTNCVTVKASKTTVFQTLIPAGCGTPKQSKPMAGSSLNAIFSPMPMSLNVSAWNGVKDEDITWTVRFSRELPDQSVHKERACHTHSTEKHNTSNGTKDVKGEGDEKGPLTSQHFSFSSQNTAGLNSVQSDLQLVNSATWPESEKLLHDGQAQPVNVNNLQSSMVGVMSPLLNREGSQVGPIPYNNTWDRNSRRKCDYLISEQKSWTQRGLTALEPLQEPSSTSPEYKCESCTLEFSGKRDVSPRARQVSRLLNITRGYTGFHRKKRHYNSKHHSRNMGCMGEALLHAAEDAVSCPLKFITDELSLDPAAKADFYSRIPQKPMAKGKVKLQANFATTFLGPYNFFMPVLFDFERQVNIIKLSENEIMLNQRFSTRKRKKPPMSKIIKINRFFITNHKKLKLRRKMKVIWLSENITDIPQSTVHIISTISNRKSKFEAEVSLRISKFTQTQPTHGESPVEAIAEYDDSVDRGGSKFLEEAKLHVGKCGGEKQELLVESIPFYTKKLSVNTKLIKKLKLGESEEIHLREYLPQRSKMYEVNSEINVKTENNIQVILENPHTNVKKSRKISEPAHRTTKQGKKKTGLSCLKEKSPFYLTEIATLIAKHLVASKEFKNVIGSMSISNLSAYKGIPSQILGSMESQLAHDGGHAALKTNVAQDFRTPEIKENCEVNTDIKSVYTYMPIQHIKTESSHNIWDMYGKSTKGNDLLQKDKAKMKRKEEFGQPILFTIASQSVQPFGADQKRQPDPFKPEAFSANTVHHKDITLQKTAIYFIDQDGNTKVGEELSKEVALSSDVHTLQIGRQNKEFKTGWKTKSKSFALPKKQAKPTISGPTWSSYASETTDPETVRQKDKAKISNVKSTMCAKQIKLKAKKIPAPLLGHGDRSNKKELGHSMQHQNSSELRRNAQNLVLKANFDLGCLISPVEKLTRVKLEKAKLKERKNILSQTILEKPSNQRQASWSGCVDVSRNLEEHIKEAHDHCTFKDIHQQFMQQLWVKSEHPCKLEDLERKMNSELPSQKDETNNLGLNTSRARGGTNIYSNHYRMTNQFLKKQDITPSGLQRTGGLNMDKPLESKESSLSPKLMVQQQNLSTDPLLGSISSQVPHQPHTEEPEEDMKISDKILKNSTQQLKKLSSEEYISGMDYMPKSIEKLLLLIKEQERRRKKSRGSKKIEITEDIKTRAQFINTTKNNGMFRQREEPNRSMATLWRQQRWCVQGISLDYVYTDEFTSKVIQQNKKTTAFMESVMYHKRVKMKVRRTASGRLLNITGYGTHSYRKELRHSINTQKELPQEKTVADLLWKNFCSSDYITSQIKTLMEIKERKGKPQRPYITSQMRLKKMNKIKMLSVQSLDNSISSTIRKSTQYIRKLKEHQMVLLDIIPQNKDQLMTGQQVEELRHINVHAHLEKEAYHVVFPDTGESDYSGLEDQRHRAGIEFEFSTTQRIKQGVMKDPIKHAFSAPPRRGEPKKTSISSSKGHDRFLMELDTFQKKTCKVQELLEQETTSRVGLGPVTCPVRESFDLENAKVPKEVGMYHSIKNISHLSGREGLRKTDTELGSKAQAFICTDLDNLHKTGIPQRDSPKPDHRPRIVLNSVHCHKRAPLHTTPALHTAKKGSGYSAKGVKMDLMGKAEPADSQLKLNRQKVDISKKLQEKQLTIFTQNKEKILEVCLSCILQQLQTKNTQKQISTKAVLSSNVFNTVVEKTSSEVNIGGADWQESACKAFPMSNTNSLMDIHRITPPQVKKPLKAIENLNYHSLNTENREEKKRIQGQKDKRIKGQNQQSPSFSVKNLKKPIPRSQNYSYVQAHLEPLTKKPLSEVGNVSGMTKGLDLPSKDQLRTMCECRPKRIFAGVIQEQTKQRDTVLPLESDSKTTNCPSLLLSKRKQSSDGIQVSKSVSNDSSSMLRVSTKSLPHKASEKKQEEIDLPKLFLHCLSIYMQFLYENEKQKGNRVMKDTIWPKRRVLNLKKLEHPCSSSTDYTPSNKAEPQCYKKEKMICVKHRQDKPGSVVIKACDPIPLPHFKLKKEKIDVLISSNVRQEKHKSQEEKNGINKGKMKGIIDSNITLKIKESALSYPSHEKKLTLLFNTTNQGRVQEELSKSDMKQTKSFILLPSLPHTNLNSRIRVGKDKSRPLKSCLPPLKPLLSLNSRKVPSSQAFNGDNLDNLMELKYLPQKKEYRNNILDLKDIIGYIHIAQKGKKLPFKCLLYEKEPWWNNKIPKNIRGNKNNLNVGQNKPWESESVPSPPYLECNPKIMEAYLQRITKFCLRSPAVLESSGAIEMYKEPTDILSSFEKAKCRPLKDRLQIASNEVMHSRKLFLRQKCSASQELQFNVEERAKKMQEDKQIKNWNKSFISSLPYSEADTKINGEETIQIRTHSFSDHSKLQRPSDIGERSHKKYTFEPVLNSVKHSMEHEVQEREERTKTEKSIHLKEKSLISQKIQLDIKEPVQELQNIKEKLNVVVTNASTWTSSCLKSERRIEKGDGVTEVTLHSLLELPFQKSLATLSEANEECAKGHITSNTQKGEDHMLQKTEHEVKIFSERVTVHIKDKDLKGNKTLSQDLPSHSKEQGKIESQNEEQTIARKDKNQKMTSNDDKNREKMDLNYVKREKFHQYDKEDLEGKEQKKAGRNGPGQEKICPEDGEQETWNHKSDTQENVTHNSIESRKANQEEKNKAKAPEHELDISTEGEDTQGIIKLVHSQQHQKLLETRKTEHTESTEDDGKSNVKTGKQCESQTWMGREKIMDTKDLMYTKDTSSNKNQLALSHVCSSTGHYGPNTTDEQTNIHEKLRHTQERKCKLGESLTLTSLPYKLDTEIKVKKETWVETRSFSPYSQRQVQSTKTIDNYLTKRKLHPPWEEEEVQTSVIDSLMHPCGPIFKTKISTPPQVSRVNKHSTLSKKKTHRYSRNEKTRPIQKRARYHNVVATKSGASVSVAIGHIASTKQIAKCAKRRKQYPEQEVQTPLLDGSTYSSGIVLKANISAPTHVFLVNEHSTSMRRNSEEKTIPKQDKARQPTVFATKIATSMPSVPYYRLSPLEDEFLMTSCTGKLIHAGSNEGIILHNVIIQANQQELYEEATYSVTDKQGKDSIALKARISPPAHLNDEMIPTFNIKEQRKDVEQGKSEPVVVLKETAFLPSPSFLKSDTRVNEQKNLLGEIQFSILPPKIQDVSVSDQKVCMESSGYVLRNRKEPTQEEEKNRLKKDVKDNMMPTSIDEKVKNLPRSHTLTIKELQRKTQEKNFVDLANTIVELSISQLQLKKFSGSQLADREVYSEIKLLKEYMPQKEKVGKEKHVVMNSIVRPMNIYLKTKKSPTLHMQNLSDLQWKTRGQGGKVKEDGSKPDVTSTKKLAKIPTAMPPQPILTLNTGIKEVCPPVLKRSSVFIGYLQKPTNSKEEIYIQPITRHTSINLQNEKQHMPEEKEAGVQIANILTTHKYQEMKAQKLKDEQDLILTEFPISPDLPHPKLYEKIEYNNTKQRLRNSALQRISTEKKTVPREAIVGDSMKDVKKNHMYQREETYRKEMTDRRGTDVTLKSRKSALSQKLHRTELHMHIKPLKSKKLDESISEPRILRKMYTSRSTTMCRGVQVDEERLENKPSFLLPQMVPALSDAEKMTDREDMCDHVRKEKQYEKHVKEAVDLTDGVHCTRAKVSSISHLLNAKEFVLNMKVLEKKIYKNKSELAVVTSRTFMSIPSAASGYSQGETQKGTAGFTTSPYPHIIKATAHDLLLRQARPQKSKCATRPRRVSERLQVESECESASPYHKIHLTGLSAMKGEGMLDTFLKGQKDQPEKCEKEPSTKIGNWEKKEIKDNLSHRAKPKFPVSPPKISLKEMLITRDTPVYSKVFVTEREQETGLGKSYRPKKDRQSNATISKMLTPEKTSLEKLSIVRVSKSQRKEEQNVIMKAQGTSLSKSRQQLKPESFPFLNLPVHSRNQRTPLQTDVEKKHVVCISSQIESGVHMSTTEFITTRRKKDSPSIVPEQEQCDLALSQKSHDSLLKSRHLEEKDETNTVSSVNLKQKKLVMDNSSTVIQKERKFKTDRSRGINLGEDKREMQKSCTINLENKAREKTSSTTSHVLSPGTEELQNKSQVVTPKKKNYPAQEKLKKELEISTVKQNLQEQKLLQTIIIDLLNTCIPICLKSQKSRFTVTNLKREMKPKYLTMRIPKHPISKMLGITGCGSPSNKKKLEYAFNKPKTMVPSSKDTSLGIIIRSLCVSKISSPYNEGTVHSKTNPKRENRVCHSKFQEKLPDARKIKDILTIVTELDFTNPLLQDSQPFVVNDQEIQKLPDVEPEVNLECEINKNLCIPTREGTAPGNDDLKVIHELDMNTLTEEKEIQNDILTPPGYPCTSEDLKDTIETLLRRTSSRNVLIPSLQPLSGTSLFDKMGECSMLSKQEEAAPETVPTTLQDKNKESKTLAEHLFPAYKALKSVFEYPVENKIQNQGLSEILEQVGAYQPGDAKASSLLEGPDTSSETYATLLCTPLLKQLTPEFKNKLPMHLVSKATEIKLNQLPEMVNISLQKCNSHSQRATSEDYSRSLYQKHTEKKCKSPKVDTVQANLKNNYRGDVHPLSCVKTTTNVSSSSMMVSMVKTEPKAIEKQESVTSLATLSNLPRSHILHKFSEKEKEDLLAHLCAKTVEIQTIGLPGIVVQSYAIANAQDKSKPLFKCIHPATKGPKRTNRVLVLFDEKSFCEIDCDLQYKYLQSLPKPLTVISRPNALSKPTAKLSVESGSEYIKVEASEESSTHSFDKELLHVSFLKQNAQEKSLPSRKFQKSTNVPAFFPGLEGTEQNDIILSDLKLEMTTERDKQCHVSFQETNSYKHSVSGTQQNTADLSDSKFDDGISDDGIDIPVNTETSTDVVGCPAPEVSDSEECVFIETNFCLTQDSQDLLFEVPKGIPLTNIHKVNEATYLKPFYSEDPNDNTRICRKHTSPYYQFKNNRKCRSNSKMQPSDWLSHSSANTIEIESTSSSITFSKAKHWTTTTWSRTSYSLTSSTTESNIKLSLTKKHGKSRMYPQIKERRKAKSDLWRKSKIYQSSDCSHSHGEKKQARKKRLYHCESKESNSQTNQMPEPNSHWQNIKFYSERREKQPFFYVCVPADSMDVIPQTIRWVVPPNILQKRHFQIPQVANISNSCHRWSSSKKFLGSLAGAFNTVRYGLIPAARGCS